MAERSHFGGDTLINRASKTFATITILSSAKQMAPFPEYRLYAGKQSLWLFLVRCRWVYAKCLSAHFQNKEKTFYKGILTYFSETEIAVKLETLLSQSCEEPSSIGQSDRL